MSEKKQVSHGHEEEEEEERIASLNSLVTSLQLRLQELEAQNAKLSSRLSSCTCSSEKEKRRSNGSIEKVTGAESTCCDYSTAKEKKKKKKKSKEKVTGYDISVMNHNCKRFVALKIMYFGQRFYGFASEAQMDPTVESELFGALEKTRLVVGDKKDWQYSRCGRTDKGVSSVGQVVALFLRSNLKKACIDNGNSSEMIPIEKLEGEVDYVRVLNRALPDDIRVLGWSPVPVGFSARFSCLSREYKYFFWEENLNISAMMSAGKKFIGEHDFRNFCKMDALNVHNFRRHISSFEILPADVRFQGNQLWAITIRGSAFLWHQVRCMVAVLFMIGQGFESPDAIDALLDTDGITRKPQYIMAPELPLVLHSCEFENIKFICSSDSGLALNRHLVKQCQTNNLQAAIFREALVTSFPVSTDETALDKPKNKKANHVPLMSRPTEPSYDERRAKMISKA